MVKPDETFDTLECSLTKFRALVNTMDLPFPGADENGRQEILNDISLCFDVVQTIRKMGRRDLAVAIAGLIHVTIKAPMNAAEVFEAVFFAINAAHIGVSTSERRIKSKLTNPRDRSKQPKRSAPDSLPVDR